jgi:polyvinyl alcohol dehydrogenase (cytochrome)
MAPLAATSAHAATVAGWTGPDTTVTASDWTSAGGNVDDTHDAAAETAISPGNVPDLQEKWSYTTTGDVSATPTVVHGTVYVPDWGGSLSAVAAGTGAKLWSYPVSDYTGISGDLSRTSPAYWMGEIVAGDGGIEATTAGPAHVFAVDATTGAKLWSTEVDSDPNSFITGSPVISNGIVYVGVSSRDEYLTTSTFRGSLVALNAATGVILWQTYTVPEGYTGGAIWDSNPVVDQQTGLVYTGTGQNDSTPAGICASPSETGCTDPPADDYFDSILAFNATTGAIVWGIHTLTADTWTQAEPSGDDFDFGAGPNLFTVSISGRRTHLLGIGQKSGVYWALNPADGDIVWDTTVGPGAPAGGIEWGTAVDGNKIYVAEANSGGVSTTLTSATGQTSTTTSGYWAALDTATGQVLWETAVPSTGTWAYSFVSGANGVMYAGSLDITGANMYALDGATGAIEWSFASGGPVVGGAAIVDGTVYWGSGYPGGPNGLGSNDKLYAFTLPRPAPPSQVYVSTTGTADGADTSCGTAAYISINAAIQAVADNGTVTVCAGTYHQEADVAKPVTLTVNGSVTINADGLLHGIDVLAPSVTVSGFTVENAIAEGILVDNVTNATIDGNAVLNDDQGARTDDYYAQCTTGREDCGGGIHLLGSSGSSVKGNTVTNDATVSGIILSAPGCRGALLRGRAGAVRGPGRRPRRGCGL